MHRMRWVIRILRAHLLLVLGLLALFAVMVMLWSIPTWPLAVLAILQRHLLLSGILGGGLTILILLWGLPKWQTFRIPDVKDRLTVENAARQTLAQIIGGAVLMAGLFFTWANLKITQETATCSDLRTSGRLLENSVRFRLGFTENETTLLLIVSENQLTIIEKSLQTPGSAHIA